FLLLELPAGTTHATVSFHRSWDVWLGCAVTLATLAGLTLGVPLWRIAIVAVGPSLVAFAIIAAAAPPRNAIAEDAHRRIHPPMIAPGGVESTLRRGQPTAIYGKNFGEPNDAVRVLVGGREAPILYKSFGQINVTVPVDAPSPADVRVEVNGCPGNAFAA